MVVMTRRFSQIVSNMISHKNASGNIIAEGFAIHLGPRKGLEIRVRAGYT